MTRRLLRTDQALTIWFRAAAKGIAMPLDLDPPISTYFESSNAHDADALARLFGPNGRVHDEREDHVGRQAIRDWAAETFRKYSTVLTPREASEEEGGTTVVSTGVSGTFPGSPIELRFRFVTEGQAIRELEIG